MWRTLRRSELVRRSLGYTLAGYFWSVARSVRFEIEPANIYEIAEREMPVILTFWHGQHFLAPFIMKSHRFRAMPTPISTRSPPRHSASA